MALSHPRPQRRSALHLYRHLLREVSYLPALCRPWITTQIQTRFNDAANRAHEPKAPSPRDLVRRAQRSLRYLHAANAGHIPRLTRLCQLATGRLGKRRRQLMADWITACGETDADSEALTARVAAGGIDTSTDTSTGTSTDVKDQSQTEKERRRKKKMKVKVKEKDAPKVNTVMPASHLAQLTSAHAPDWLDKWDTDLIMAIAKGQYERQANAWPNQVRKTYDRVTMPSIENCWGRPLGPRILRRRLLKHWKDVGGKLMPPLPRGEWERLKALAEGTAKKGFFHVPMRRTLAKSKDPEEGGEEEEEAKPVWRGWENYANVSAKTLGRDDSRSLKVLSGGLDEDPRGQGNPRKVRCLAKPRLMRRHVYGTLWRQSPLASKNDKGKWQITWGDDGLKAAQAAKSELLFFENVPASAGKDKRAKND